jgi:hypothetical protein
MDPEVLLMEILDLLSDMSKHVDYRPIIHNGWSVEEIVLHVENYEQWLRKGGYKPDVQSVVEKWLTDKQNKDKNSPDKKQKQFWYGAEL